MHCGIAVFIPCIELNLMDELLGMIYQQSENPFLILRTLDVLCVKCDKLHKNVPD